MMLYGREHTSSATITVDGGFATAFMDIVCQYRSITAFTVRPVLIKGNQTTTANLCSMWHVADSTTELIMPYPYANSSFSSDIEHIAGVYRVGNSNTIMLNGCCGSTSYSVYMSVFTYIVE